MLPKKKKNLEALRIKIRNAELKIKEVHNWLIIIPWDVQTNLFYFSGNTFWISTWKVDLVQNLQIENDSMLFTDS